MNAGQQTNLERLKASADITRLFDKGRRVRIREVQILWLPGQADRTRYAVCVGKRNGNAVQRNRMKRVLRELIRSGRDRIPSGIDFAILPRPRPTDAGVSRWSQPFEELWSRLARDVAGGTGSGPCPPQG